MLLDVVSVSQTSVLTALIRSRTDTIGITNQTFCQLNKSTTSFSAPISVICTGDKGDWNGKFQPNKLFAVQTCETFRNLFIHWVGI